MDESLRRVVSALDKLADVGLLWEKGLLNPGGPHRRLRGHHYPISIGEDECLVFGKLVEHFRPEHCYIIGNAFGFLLLWLPSEGLKHRAGLIDEEHEAGRIRATDLGGIRHWALPRCRHLDCWSEQIA